MDGNNIVFPNVYYVPVVVADEIGGDDYAVFVEAANSGTQPIVTATLDFYKLRSEASRAESTPQFDAMAVMLALELLNTNVCGEDGRIFQFGFDSVHFAENTDDGLQPFPEAPRAAYSFHTGIMRYRRVAGTMSQHYRIYLRCRRNTRSGISHQGGIEICITRNQSGSLSRHGSTIGRGGRLVWSRYEDE